jgi:DNA-binding LacI/PurR family transcriptional regulator
MAEPVQTRREPKYRQLKTILEARIREGVWGHGVRVPSEPELAVQFGLSRQTVRQAQELLEAEGWLTREQGRGTFVCNPPRPRRAAAGNAGQRDVGVLIPCITISLYPALARGLEDILREHGYHLVVGSYDVIPEKEQRCLGDMVAKPVAGLVACPSYNSRPADYQAALAQGVPLVLMDSPLPGIEVDLVATDGYWSALHGAAELVRSGCRRVAFLAGHFTAATSRERLAGCRSALEAAGLELAPELILEGDFAAAFGYQATRRLLAEHPEVDGLFIANDPITVGAVQAALEAGVRPGNGLQVCTFDEPDLPLEWRRAMILLKQPRYDLGRAAGELLLKRIGERRQHRTPAPAQRVRLQAEIVVPQTAAVPRPNAAVLTGAQP